ncbi:Hsp20/alpha crystallin family protein [Pseudodesulfovibrio sp. zrk46]|uniref:Hsp20/alpha crystallin family protein n=1 Tax=Pseudodesulfovibrio sp. zrk46 TaxID=2725288 RepID=UPI0014491E27|nr:Hsp20/alpha crystallin family protein [Pseudodesulfovibrio sp. zrk46]QJB57777.1 Hsp20/alpha crystallin family protein [Pseudodesulfovibrio sp. zrk46]
MADLKRWSKDEISRMRHEMDRLFDDLCSDFDLPVMVCRIAGDLDISEEGGTLVARMELGNVNPDDVDVSVFDRRLIIAAETVEPIGNKTKTQTFRKEVKLPCVIKTEDVKAEFKNGVLEVRLPKCPTQLGQTIQIEKK